MSACTQAEVESGQAVGVDAFLAKPFEPMDLVRMVRRLMSRGRCDGVEGSAGEMEGEGAAGGEAGRPEGEVGEMGEAGKVGDVEGGPEAAVRPAG
ncbi:Response regulator OS=Streptomyces rimosus subsp. rimosus (strain ATCC / DSM 40260 /JCM 4667 / NRRL 2234) OX=1265868 GN=SRIM_028035 PE=4 SV=1 [Streptomyces rimosus subsp. rimosus]